MKQMVKPYDNVNNVAKAVGITVRLFRESLQDLTQCIRAMHCRIHSASHLVDRVTFMRVPRKY